MLNRLLASKNYAQGRWAKRQALFALVALEYFKDGTQKNLQNIMRDLSERILSNTEFASEDYQ